MAQGLAEEALRTGGRLKAARARRVSMWSERRGQDNDAFARRGAGHRRRSRYSRALRW